VLQHVSGRLRRHPRWADSLVAAFLLGFSLLAYEVGPMAVVLAIVLCVPLVVRREYPVAVLLWVFTIGFGQLVTNTPARLHDFSIIIAIYTVTERGPRWAARLGVWGGLLGAVLAALEWSRAPDGTYRLVGMAVVAAPVVVAWTLGDNLRIRRAYLAGLEERAARLEREREARDRVAVAQERARIARELHDVVAHNVSVMVVQADGAGCALADGELADTARAIDAIGRTGRTALAEMRLALGVLRSSEGTGEGYAPQPDVTGIEELAGQVPLPVEVTVQGEPRALPPGLGLAAYRIVQEALTNTMKHAGPGAAVSVRLGYEDGGMRVVVADDGSGLMADGDSGHGIVGMRERAAVFGGTVRTGERADGGFQVEAWLPA
jgi:signal transduction histidine kinase